MKNLYKSFKITLAFCALLACFYVLILLGVSTLATPQGGNAQTVTYKGKVVGVANVGQCFTGMEYFWGRPSAVDYNGSGSGGSNKATTNPQYLSVVQERVDTFLVSHPYLTRADVPSEMVTASASGLDPDISPSSAYVQIRRVAQARGLSESEVKTIVDTVLEKPLLGLFGTARVNVLRLNVALDHVSDR